MEYVYDENGTPNPRPNRIEPAVVDGAEYDYYVRLNSSAEAWGISFERSISVTAETKTDELQKVYDLLVSELGEPEELTGAHSVGEALTEEFANRTSYTEWWILDEDYEMAFDPGLDMALTCHLTVRYESPGLTIAYITRSISPPACTKSRATAKAASRSRPSNLQSPGKNPGAFLILWGKGPRKESLRRSFFDKIYKKLTRKYSLPYKFFTFA